jgi:hypothetical protein
VIYDVQASWGREYALATYFLTSTGDDGIGMDTGGLPDDWWAGWDTDLGAALGGRYEWNGVLRRDFERGTVLVNQPDQPTRTLSPGGSWRRLDGSEVMTVELQAREGVVLLGEGEAPAPAEPDLAAGQPTEASSMELPQLAADNAVDGSGGTRFGSAWENDQWWQVDLGEPKPVNRVEIAWEAAYASSYRILTSLDGTSWHEAASVSLESAGNEATEFVPRLARYVRIVGVERATQYGISFWEVKVYGEPLVLPAPTTPRPPQVTPPLPITPAPAAGPISQARPSRRIRALRRVAARRCHTRPHKRALRAAARRKTRCRRH